jgi:hypothetical protein
MSGSRWSFPLTESPRCVGTTAGLCPRTENVSEREAQTPVIKQRFTQLSALAAVVMALPVNAALLTRAALGTSGRARTKSFHS